VPVVVPLVTRGPLLLTPFLSKFIKFIKKTFDWMDAQLFHELYRWARFRHPRKTGGWCVSRYWKQRGNRKNFGDGTAWLAKYADTPIERHIKVKGDKSPGACPEACPELVEGLAEGMETGRTGFSAEDATRRNRHGGSTC